MRAFVCCRLAEIKQPLVEQPTPVEQPPPTLPCSSASIKQLYPYVEDDNGAWRFLGPT
jgi:hypothetical protein